MLYFFECDSLFSKNVAERIGLMVLRAVRSEKCQNLGGLKCGKKVQNRGHCRNRQKVIGILVEFSTCYEFSRNFNQIFGNIHNLQSLKNVL